MPQDRLQSISLSMACSSKFVASRTCAMPINLKAFGEVIRHERQQRGLSQEGLAALSGLSRAFVGEIERGEVNVSFSTLIALAGGLNIPATMVVAEYERKTGEG